jgi:hypothetical protein
LDAERRGLLRVNFYAEKQQWPEVLKAAAGLPESTLASRLQVFRALYYLGELPERQFEFEQFRRIDFFGAMDRGAGPEFCLPQALTLLELGQVNLAEHYAHESFEILGNRPETMEVLAKVNMAKGRMAVARIFLNLLSQHPFHKAWARRYLEAMETDPQLLKDEELSRIRGRMVTSDITSSSEPSFMLLEQLLEANGTNRMAFEYLMANYLATIETAKAVKVIERAKLPTLPRYYQEVILMDGWLRGNEAPASSIAGITPETVSRFERFRDIYNRSGGKEKAKAVLEREFPDSYWFFAVYAYSPGVPLRVKGGSL